MTIFKYAEKIFRMSWVNVDIPMRQRFVVEQSIWFFWLMNCGKSKHIVENEECSLLSVETVAIRDNMQMAMEREQSNSQHHSHRRAHALLFALASAARLIFYLHDFACEPGLILCLQKMSKKKSSHEDKKSKLNQLRLKLAQQRLLTYLLLLISIRMHRIWSS